jgi:diguanylate cyclase (GGDEF)-like protein
VVVTGIPLPDDEVFGRRAVAVVAAVATAVVGMERVVRPEPWSVLTAPFVAVALLVVLGLLAIDRVEPATAGRWTVVGLGVIFLGGFLAHLLGTTPELRDPGALAFRGVTTVTLISGAAYVSLGPRVGRVWAAVMLSGWLLGSLTVFRMDAGLGMATTDVRSLARPVMLATGVVVAILVLFDVATSVARRLGSRAASGMAIAATAVQLARVDDLTGLPNRRAVREALEGLVRAGSGAVVLADVDHFKRLNDMHGHEIGDEALRAVARALQLGVRSDDLVGRWGGEEFLVVLRGADRLSASEVAERCREAVTSAYPPVPVTASFGVAELTAAGVEDALRRADAALYDAKHAGRNTVAVAGRG